MDILRKTRMVTESHEKSRDDTDIPENTISILSRRLINVLIYLVG